MLEIMEIPPTEVSDGDEKALPKSRASTATLIGMFRVA